MFSQKVRPSELARRLRVTRQEVNRLIDGRYKSKIDGIAGAFKALGMTMVIRAV
jgi:plasmid maintenance system antidote protein VapI